MAAAITATVIPIHKSVVTLLCIESQTQSGFLKLKMALPFLVLV
jgi:hypothetical protein